MKCSLHKICQQFLFRDSIYSPLAFAFSLLAPLAPPPQPSAATGCVRCGAERRVRLTTSGKCSGLIASGAPSSAFWLRTKETSMQSIGFDSDQQLSSMFAARCFMAPRSFCNAFRCAMWASKSISAHRIPPEKKEYEFRSLGAFIILSFRSSQHICSPEPRLSRHFVARVRISEHN